MADIEVLIGFLIGCAFSLIVTFATLSIGDCLKSETDTEILEKACVYIYENESQETYLQYCK